VQLEVKQNGVTNEESEVLKDVTLAAVRHDIAYNSREDSYPQGQYATLLALESGTANFVRICNVTPHRTERFFEVIRSNIEGLNRKMRVKADIPRTLLNVEKAALEIVTWCLRER
jgi:hypothetical protein